MKKHYTQGRELAAKGRHGDSMLLHVSPKEVHGLASLGALTGRRVTINPTTGLPEAFDFTSLLPAVAGLVAGAVTMNPVVGAGVAAAAAGGRTAAMGGSTGDVLQSAAISGIGSYAGGQLATGLSELGTAGTAGAAAGQLPTAAGVDAARTAAEATAAKVATAQTAATTAGTAGATTAAVPLGSGFADVDAAFPPFAVTPAAAVAPPAAAAAPQTTAQNISAFGTKVGNVGRALTDNTSEALKYMGTHYAQTGGTLLGLSGIGQYQPPVDTDDDKKTKYPLRPGFGTMMPPQVKSFPGADYNPDSGDWNYFPDAGKPPVLPAPPTAGRYFASGGGSVPSGLRAMPAHRMASGGESDASLAALRRPYGESFYEPMADYTPSYVTPSTGSGVLGMGLESGQHSAGGVYGRGFNARGGVDFVGEGGSGDGTAGSSNDMGPDPGGDASGADSGGTAESNTGGPNGMARGGLAALRKAAGGRAAGKPDNYGMTAGLMAEARAALLGQHDDPRRALARFESVFGGEALQILRDKVGGGRISGAGGGLDDLIPGDIEGKQRVRLADGEFVVPADVVSGIGDGSTDHGVRKLHEMMTNVRKERTGKRTQPKRLRAGALIV